MLETQPNNFSFTSFINSCSMPNISLAFQATICYMQWRLRNGPINTDHQYLAWL